MLLTTAAYLLYFSDIFCVTFAMKPEPADITLENTVRRSLRGEKIEEDDSLVGTFTVDPISNILHDEVTHSIILNKRKKSSYWGAFNDPEWKNQWYMQDYRTKLGPVMDLNLVPVYRMGITGEGIYVAVVDYGVEMSHPDLQQNLVKNLAYTVKGGKRGVAKPITTGIFPRRREDHGTQSAGVIGMTANNSICGVGMAYNAKLVAISLEGNFMMSEDGCNSKALLHAKDKVDIYSNSWGPPDSGNHMDKIGRRMMLAINDGVEKGRGGLGSIYTFPAGNGHESGEDNCSGDEIVNYIHTIAIAAATEEGERAPFSECCSAIYATTYSGGGKQNGVVVSSTTLDGKCSSYYSGTSAATPQASAIIALVLQANKKLTYRDVMHLITMGSEVAPLADNDSWRKNGAGFWVSNEFGFGLMNALNMVKLALEWRNVPERKLCTFDFKIGQNAIFRVDKPAIIKQTTDGCQGDHYWNAVYFLEQVILTSSIDHHYRGAISIVLKSPKGTQSEIMSPRKRDKAHRGLDEWNSKSLHFWGENPNGEWQIEVKAIFSREGVSKAVENLLQVIMAIGKLQKADFSETGRVHSFKLSLYGTLTKPAHHEKRLVPRSYSAFRTADFKSSDPLTPMQRSPGGMAS